MCIGTKSVAYPEIEAHSEIEAYPEIEAQPECNTFNILDRKPHFKLNVANSKTKDS